jgi:HTH-type transcriptional regulator / antitoxin HigA
MKPKVLKTERDYQAALAYVERLMDQPSPDEGELDLWSLLVENYEEAHFAIATPDPIEAIRFRLEQAGLQTADLLPYLQSKSKISEIMNRKRPLSLAMIRALHAGLKIPAAVLVQESAAPKSRNRPTNLRRKAHRRNQPVAA